jgi:secreted trypsin-like serine protease
MVGGNKTFPGEWPWLASLHYSNGDYFCGSSLINERMLVTGN